MNLESLKQYFEDVCLSHKEINSFEFGSNYNIAESGADKYPLVYYELPYLITYDLDRGVDTIQISFSVLLYSKQDDVVEDHYCISHAKTIGDQIISRINDENSKFQISAANSVSVREFSDDNVAGFRWDLTILLPNEICDIESPFNNE